MKNEIQAVFIDRDGTIGGDKEIKYPGKLKLFPFTKEAIKLLKDMNINVFAFTNQPGVGRGEAKLDDFKKELFNFGFKKSYICTHTVEENCSCRKPKPELLIRAVDEYKMDISKCIVIGDRWSDMLAAENAGAKKILVRTGAGEDSLNKYRYKWANVTPDYVAKNLLEAVIWIML